MLTLYYKPTCPFCQNVFEVTDEFNIELDLQDISDDDAAREELIEKGGKQQVPFLVDTDKDVSMYESNDIIAYLKENYAGAAPSGPRVHQGGSTCVACEG